MGPAGVSLLQKVRTLLDNNGYREPLPPEGVPLAHRLIQDLILRNKELKEAVSSLKECKEKCEALNLSVEPLREENGRLLTKLNRLHMENLKERERNDKLAKDITNCTCQLETEKQDLLFLIGELKRKISSLEEESRKKSDRILQLQEHNLKAVVVTPGGSKRPVASQRQRMEISSHLDNMTASSRKCQTCGCASESRRSKNKDLYVADLLRMTDRKLLSLQEDVETHKQNALRWEEMCNEIKKKIDNRDAEISRLQMLLEGGRPISAVLADNKVMAAHSKLHQFQLENDLLAKTNAQLELKLRSALGETHEAKNRAMAMKDVTIDLTTELENVAATNRQLQQDCDTTAGTLTMKLAKNKEKLKYCEGDLVEQHDLYHVTRDERDELQRELSRLSHVHLRLKEDLNHLKEEISHLNEANGLLKEERHRLEDILARGQGERKAMADRINTLTVQLQEMDMERMSLKSEAAALRTNIGSLETAKAEVESNLKFYKKETEKLGGQMRDLELEKAYIRGEMVKVQNSKEQLEEENRCYKEQVRDLEEQKSSAEQARDYFSCDVTKFREKLTELQLQDEKLKNKLSELTDEKGSVERERDNYSEQVVQLLDILKVKPSVAGAEGTKNKLRLEEELPKVKYERDVLKQELNFYKTQLQSLKNQMRRPRRADDQVYEAFERVSPPIVAESRELPEDMETLKSERNFFQEQMEHFKQLYNDAKLKLLRQKGPSRVSPPVEDVSRVSSVSPPSVESPPVGKELNELRAVRHELRVCEQEREFFREQYERLKSSFSKSLSPSEMESADIESLIRERNVLRSERDFYRNQYRELSNKISEWAMEPTTLKPPAMKRELEKVLAEKRALALSKARLEAQIMNMRGDMAELEKETREAMVDKRGLAKSIENLQNAVMQQVPPSMQNFIKEIRKSRDAALEEVEKVKQEREALRAKIKILSAQQIKDRAATQEDFSALQLQREESVALSSDLEQRVKAQASIISSMQTQIETLETALKQAHAQFGMSSKQSEELKKQMQQKTGEADDQGQQLQLRSHQLAAAQTKIHDLEKEMTNVEQEVARLESEAKVLRGNLGRMDTDKDALTTELDSKSEFILTLKNELKSRATQLAGFEAKVTKLEATIDSCEATIEAEKRKVAGLSEQCDQLQQDLAVSTEQREVANKEIRRLQMEVLGQAADLKEHQAELERTKLCRENFKKKAQEYCRTLERLSQAITNKDKEQDTLMQQYLSLNETVVSLKSLNASLEEMSAAKTHEIHRMEDLIKTSKEERESLISQVNEALLKNETLEKKCQQIEEAKFSLEKDFLANKDLTQKVEMRRSEADSESRRLGAYLEKLMEEKKSLEHELQSVSSQLMSERNALRSLEEVLTEKRKSEFLTESNIKQVEIEKLQLQRKVAELTSELDSEVGEAKRLRSRLASLELDVERLKRQVTNEQYERERAEQELRRVRKYSQIQGALSALQEGEDVIQRTSMRPLDTSVLPSSSPSPPSEGTARHHCMTSPVPAYFSPVPSIGSSKQYHETASSITHSGGISQSFAPPRLPTNTYSQTALTSPRREQVFPEKRLSSASLCYGDSREGDGVKLTEGSLRDNGHYIVTQPESNGLHPSVTTTTLTRSTYTTPRSTHTEPKSVHSWQISSHSSSRVSRTVQESATKSETGQQYAAESVRTSVTMSSHTSSSSSSLSNATYTISPADSKSLSSPSLRASFTESQSQLSVHSKSPIYTASHSSWNSGSLLQSRPSSHVRSHSATRTSTFALLPSTEDISAHHSRSHTITRSGSLPETLQPLASSRTSSVAQSLPHLQPFIKPSITPHKTFYETVPDIPLELGKSFKPIDEQTYPFDKSVCPVDKNSSTVDDSTSSIEKELNDQPLESNGR